jgi:pyruvate/2-oxoglutarate dehydrogenase complex dihydrolipoamide dehydrogenase (E3) component
LTAAAEAAESGHEVVLVERFDRIGGQLALAAETPGTGEISRALVELYVRRLAHAGVEIELETMADAEVAAGYAPDAVVVAAGARPYEPDLPLAGIEVVQAWDILAGPIPQSRRVVVADWGGDPSGLDAAELLARAGNDMTLAVASVAVGEAVHQYRRNLYLQRLYRAGVAVLHHHRLTEASDGEVELANVFAPERSTRVTADLLVLALGRVPEDGLAPVLTAAGFRVEEAGDCLSPRSIEEAILEGTLAARRVLAVA